jgi:hypothetical protein
MDNFKEAVLKQHMSHTLTSRKTAEQRWIGLMQFLKFCSTSEKEEVASESVDKIWNDALLFTEGYRDFCFKEYGVIIEHRPATIPGQASGYLETRKKLKSIYGDQFSGTIWPNQERQWWSVGYVKVSEAIEDSNPSNDPFVNKKRYYKEI